VIVVLFSDSCILECSLYYLVIAASCFSTSKINSPQSQSECYVPSPSSLMFLDLQHFYFEALDIPSNRFKPRPDVGKELEFFFHFLLFENVLKTFVSKVNQISFQYGESAMYLSIVT
jgi:hypothetical protein